MRRILAALTLAGSLAGFLAAQAAVTESAPAPATAPSSRPADAAAVLERLAAPLATAGRSPCLVAGVVRDGHRTIRGFGRVRAGADAAPDGRTVFEIGSITKTFTALLLADMVERGEVRLEQTLQSLLPAELRVPERNGKAITLAQLATHTSALPRLPWNLAPRTMRNPYAEYDAPKLQELFAILELGRDPGARYEYSNLGYGLLGHALVLHAKAADYEALLRKRVLDPLGLADTRITLAPEQAARLAPGHDEKGNVVANWTFGLIAGAGALRGTVADLLDYGEQAGGLRESPLAAAFRRCTKVTFQQRELRVGLGWHLARIGGVEVVWHNGGTGGYRSHLAIAPERGLVVAVLSASVHQVDELAQQILREML